MPILPLMLMIALLSHGLIAPNDPWVSPAWLVCLVVLPKLTLAFGYWLACSWATPAIIKQQDGFASRCLDWAGFLYRVAVVGLFVIDLAAGGLITLRQQLFDLVLIDELIMLVPSLAMLIWGWSQIYHVSRQLAEARGQTAMTRREFLLSEMRHQLATSMLPLLLWLAANETIDFAWPQSATGSPFNELETDAGVVVDPRSIVNFFLGAGIFILSPLMLRHIWSTEPLPAGETRDRLDAMCHEYRIAIRELLRWKTYGKLLNAAVMGVVGRFRFILLSDAILDALSPEQIEAVMAHEIAHIRLRHLPWSLLLTIGLLGTFEGMCTAIALPIVGFVIGDAQTWDPQTLAWMLGWVNGLIILATIAGWWLVFGWAARRMEHQADAFAAKHLANGEDDTIDHDAAQTMIDALLVVCERNHVDPQHWSWRHGAIEKRLHHLRSLVGQAKSTLPIDRDFARIRVAGLIVFVLGVAIQFALVPYLTDLTHLGGHDAPARPASDGRQVEDGIVRQNE